MKIIKQYFYEKSNFNNEADSVIGYDFKLKFYEL